jgi:hypothetical protein
VRKEQNDGPRRATTRMQWVASGWLDAASRFPCLRGLLPRSSGAPSGGWMRPASGRGRPNRKVEIGRAEREFFFGCKVSFRFFIYAFTSAHTMGQYSNMVQKT